MKTNLKEMQQKTVIEYKPVQQKKLPMYLLTSVEKHTTRHSSEFEIVVTLFTASLILIGLALWLF